MRTIIHGARARCQVAMAHQHQTVYTELSHPETMT